MKLFEYLANELVEKRIKFTNPKAFFDFWSISHLLFGVILGLILLSAGLKYPLLLIAPFIIMVGWEVYEFRKKTGENLLNQSSDILFGMIGLFVSDIIFFDNFIFDIIALVISIFFFVFLKLVGNQYEKKLGIKQ